MQNARLEPLLGVESLRPHESSLQLAAISSIDGIELSFMIGSAVFLYRYSEDGPLIDRFFQGLERAPYIANVCGAKGAVEQQSSACVLCTHVVLLPT